MRTKFIGFSLLLLTSLSVFSQIKHIGIPFYSFYPIESQGIPLQVLGIDENIRGFLCIATNNGILEYDGKNWNKFITNSAVNCIKIHNSGRIYAGLSNSFGYFNLNNSGDYNYYPLNLQLQGIDSLQLNVFQVNSTSTNIYFLTSKRIFIYDHQKGSLVQIDAETELFTTCVFRDRILIAQANYGLRMIEDISMKEINGGDYFKNIHVKRIIPYDNESLLIFDDRKAYIFNFRKGKIENGITKSFNNNFKLKCENITSVFNIGSNKFGITTCNDGVSIINNDGTVYQHFDIENILPTKVAWFGKETIDGNIWIALDNGILKIENLLPLSKLILSYGKPINVHSILRFQKKLFISSSTGLYVKDLEIDSAYIHNVKEINFKCSNLSYFIEKTGPIVDSSVLCSTNNGLYAIDKNSISLLTEKVIVNDALQSLINPNLILLATEKGFGIMEYNSGAVSNIKYQMNLSVPIQKIVETKDGQVLASTKNYGIYILDSNEGKYNVVSIIKKTDLGYLNPGNIVQIGDNVYFNDENIIANYNTILKSNSFLNLKTTEKTGSATGAYLLKQFSSKNLWITTVNEDLLTPFNYSESQSSYNVLFKRLKNEGILSVYTEPNGNVWFGGVKGVICAQQFNHSKFIGTKPSLFIVKVSVNNSNTSLINNENYFLYNQKYSIQRSIEYNNNHIKVNVTCPYFISEENNQYSFFLPGYDKEWSRWSKNNTKEFNRLKEGSYTLLIKSKNIFDIESSVITLDFTIKTPWYRSAIAYFTFGLIIILCSYILLKLFQSRYKREKHRLEKIIFQRTSEILDQKSKIEIQAKQLDSINKNLMQLSIVARKTNNPVIITNTNCEVEWTNECYQKYFNTNSSNLFKTKLQDLFTDYELNEKVKLCLSTKKPISYSEKISSSSNEFIWFQITISPVLDKINNVISLIIIFSDITNIVELNKIRDIITSVITHDLKSPLLGFLIFTKTLADNLDLYEKNQVKEGLITMHNNASSIFNLLENLTDWFKSQRGEISFLPGNFDISVSINEVFVLFGHQAVSKKIELVNKVPPNSNVFADENMVRTILRNLISNAIKFSDKGSIIVSSLSFANYIEISVSDDGIGIDKNTKSKLFNLKDNEGFGLLICKEFVNKNGGKIWYDENEEKTTFKFSLQNNKLKWQ